MTERMKSAQRTPLSELGTHREGRDIARDTNDAESRKAKILPLIAMLGTATAVATVVASMPEPETGTFGVSNPNACKDVPEGIGDIEGYRNACRTLVAACAEQAGVLKVLASDMSQGPKGPNAASVIGLQNEAKRLRSIMEEAIGGMDRASGGRKPEKIVCLNEGPNAKRPIIERTSRRWRRP